MSQPEGLRRSQRRVGQPSTSASNSPRARPSGDPKASATETLHDIANRIGVSLASAPIYGLVVSVNAEGVARIEGAVRNDEDYANAARLARVPGVRRVLNHLTLDPLVGSEPVQRSVLSPELAAQIELNHLHVAQGTEIDLNDWVGTTDTAEATDEAEPYFPPTDPPVRGASREDEGIEVVGGFSGTSLDAPINLIRLPPALSTGDDELEREVRLALLEDAATSDLDIRVYARNGIVHLRGDVGSIEEAEAAEEIASRVPNVEEVREELSVRGV